MQAPANENWQFAGLITGQGIRRLALADRQMLVVQSDDEVLVTDAGCAHCGELLNPALDDISAAVCGHCSTRNSFSSADSDSESRKCYPVLIVDDEIYVLLEADRDEIEGSGNGI